MDNAQISAYDQALRETFMEHETGALLTYEGAVPLVEQTCALLPHAMGVPPPRPTYEILTTIADGNPCHFIANLQLPTAISLPVEELVFHGTARTSKAEAKRAIAFEAAKTLRKYNLLNEYMLPYREKKGDEAQDGEGRQLGEDLDMEFDVEVPFTWGNIWQDDPQLYIHRIAVEGIVTIAIIAARQIKLDPEPLQLWQGRDKDERQVEVQVYEGELLIPPEGMTIEETREALENYTKTVMTRCIRPNFEMEHRMACLFAPIAPNGDLDLPMISRLSKDERTPWTHPDAYSFLAFDSMGRQVKIECERPDLTPLSEPVPVQQPSGEIQCREEGFHSYDAYAFKKLCYMTDSEKLLEDSDQTMLQVVSLRRRRNNLVGQQFAIQGVILHGRTKGQKQGQRFIIARKLVRVSNIPIEGRETLMVSLGID